MCHLLFSSKLLKIENVLILLIAQKTLFLEANDLNSHLGWNDLQANKGNQMTWPNAAHTWKSTPLSFCFSLLGWCEEGETTQTMQNSPTICYTYFLRQRECIFARMLLTSPTLSQSSTTILRRPHLIKSISCPTSPSENLFTLKQIDFQKKGYMFLSFFFVLHSHITLLYQSWFNMRICFVDMYIPIWV